MMDSLTGGGIDFPQQIVITQPTPPANEVDLLAWATGVLVPLVLGIGGWYFMSRRKK